ncbi:hypothetical protein [Altericista sp. CCNU0014]|uniref:hypothetical protein n=1 Tax=Altericista sp. CCNU0014 TaxID=3082949 RepID=UPI00384EA36E
MTVNFELPSFHHTQPVKFVGGEGVVKKVKSEAGRWIYYVEMTLGQEPSFGRVGEETTIILNESDLRAA